ncbi:MAG: 2-amino-4-hydroxy-6-hydroxymethyldihydropteridine diphosphokinase [Paracoccaceae bacterium]
MPQVGTGSETDTLALVALGGNAISDRGGPAETLRAALRELDGESVRLVAQSPLYATPCFPPGAGPDFVNAAAVLETSLGAEALLTHLHGIERRFGRTRRVRWGQRTLDLDLLDFGGQVRPDAAGHVHWRDLPPAKQKRQAPDEIILPHPRLQDRAFVLVPLADVAPDWRHPVTGQTVRQMLAALPEAEKAAIRAL